MVKWWSWSNYYFPFYTNKLKNQRKCQFVSLWFKFGSSLQVPLFKILRDHKEPNHTVPSPIARPMPTQPPGSRAGEIPDVNTNITLSPTKGGYIVYTCIICRSNWNFNNPPPPPPKLSSGIWLSSVPGEWGSWPLTAWGWKNRTRNVRFQIIVFFGRWSR